jgi:hypothetical protein
MATPTDPLAGKPEPTPTPEPEPQGRKRRIVCDFCACELASDGGVLKTSERAKKLERADKEITDLQGRLDTKTQELEDLKAKQTAPAPVPDPAKPPNGGGVKEKHTAKPLFGGWK